jgi:hypothetical protein
MKSNGLKSGKIDTNTQNVKILCIECGRTLEFRVENETIVGGDGIIAINLPSAVCHECLNTVLDKLADPPGLVCTRNLNPILAGEIIGSFDFLLSPSQAVDFFLFVFPENDLVHAACKRRLRGEKE